MGGVDFNGEPVHSCDVCGALVPAGRLDLHSGSHAEPASVDIAWLDGLDADELTAELSNQPISVGPVEAVLAVLRDKATAGT